MREIVRLTGKFFGIACNDGVGVAARRSLDRVFLKLGLVPRREVERRLNEIERRLDGAGPGASASGDGVEIQVTRNMESIRWLTETVSGTGAAPSAISDGDLPVSVVMAVGGCEGQDVSRAVGSVLAQTYRSFEMIVVGAGSSGRLHGVVGGRATDPRVRFVEADVEGVAAARNAGLAAASGEVVAYIDPGEAWFEGYLARLVAAYSDPDIETAYAAQLVEDRGTGSSWVRCIEFDREHFRRDAGIGLGAFSHRRSCFETQGGFDTALGGLDGWDLMCRYTVDRAPVFLGIVCGKAFEDGSAAPAAGGSFHYNRYLLQKKYDVAIARPLRVLCLAQAYPHLAETALRSEIVRMQKWGVHVEVWSEEAQPRSPHAPEAPVHTGPLDDAIAAVRPGLFHVHGIDLIERHRDVLVRTGLPITVRGRDGEDDPQRLSGLMQDGAVQKSYLAPHLTRGAAGSPVVRALPCSFIPDLFHPELQKDRLMVFGVTMSADGADARSFIDIAQQCPDHRFVLALMRPAQGNDPTDAVVSFNAGRERPVDIRVDPTMEAVAELMREAGLYLHAHGGTERVGIPVEMIEAMATGCVVLVPAGSGAQELLGDAAVFYETGEESASWIVWQARGWYDAQWSAAQRASIDHAYGHHTDMDVLAPVRDDWLALTDHESASDLLDAAQHPDVKPVVDFLADDPVLSRFHIAFRSYITHGLGTYHLLREWGSDADVCLAGLLHAIYRRGRVDPDRANRERVRELVGERAEWLIYLFGAIARSTFGEAMNGETPYVFRDVIAHDDMTVDDDDLRQLMLIHVAEWIEKVGRSPGHVRRSGVYDEMALRLGGEALRAFRQACSDTDGSAAKAS